MPVIAGIISRHQFRLIEAHSGAEADQGEAILRVQMLDHVGCRLLGLDHLLALHAAAGVQHQDDVAGDDLARLDARRDQQQEETVLSGFLVGEQAEADILRRDGVVELEVIGCGHVGVLVAHDGAEVAWPVDGHAVAGRIEGADGLVGTQLDADGLFIERRLGVQAGRLGIDVMERAVLGRQQVAVRDLDLAFRAGRDGEDIGLDGVVAHILQQRRVAQLAHDGIVDGAGLVLGQDFGLDGHAVDPHGQLGDGRAGRQREEVRTLQHPVVGVAKDLLNVGRCDLIGDGHIDALVGNLQSFHVPDRRGNRAIDADRRLVDGRRDNRFGCDLRRRLILGAGACGAQPGQQRDEQGGDSGCLLHFVPP